MGVCGSNTKGSSGTPLSAICPETMQHLNIERQFANLMDVKDSNNLNQRYLYMYKVDEKVKIGQGIRKTHGYISRVPLEVIKKKRAEFWGRFRLNAETRVDGSKGTWEALKFACENEDESLSIAALHAAGVKLLFKSVQICYDDTKLLYHLPIFLVNDPTGYEESKPEAPVAEAKIKVAPQ